MAYVYLTILIMLWGMTATVSKLCFAGLSPFLILCVSCALAAVTLFLANIKTIGKRIKALKLVDFIKMILIGTLGILVHNVLMQMGIAALPAEQAYGIVYLWPSFVVIFSAPILGERLTIFKILAILVSFVGSFCIGTNGDLSVAFSDNLYGILICVLSAACYGLYSPLNSREKYDKILALMFTFAVDAVLAGIICMGEQSFVPLNNLQIGGLVFSGILTYGVGYICWFRAVDRGNTAIVSTLVYMSPVVSLFATALVLGEEITIFKVIGTVLVVVGAVLQILFSHGQQKWSTRA